MKITIDLSLTESNKMAISSVLNCTEAQLNENLTLCCASALKEYLSMFQGEKVYKRGSDILEYRLFLLITTLFSGLLPDEKRISALFQKTPTESRTLLRSVVSKYHIALRPVIENTLSQTLSNATQESQQHNYFMTIPSQIVVDELNRFLSEIDGGLPPVIKKRSSIGTYEIKPSSYNALSIRLLPTEASNVL